MERHFSELDPASADDVDAILAALASDQWQDPTMEAFCDEVIAKTPDDSLRAAARVAAGRYAYMRSDYIAAAGFCLQALEAVWGTGTRVEVAACVNLAMVWLEQKRYFEVLVLCRRVIRYAEGAGVFHAVPYARIHLAGVLLELGDTSRARIAIDAAAGEESLLPEVSRANHRRNVHVLKIEQALDNGDNDTALGWIPQLHTEDMGDPRHELTLEARALVAAGRFEDAESVLERARNIQHERDPTAFVRARLALECAAHREGTTAVEPRAEWLLDRLDSDARESISAARRMNVAIAVGRLLVANGGDTRLARRAFDIAGAAAIERTAELDGFLREWPELRELDEEDREILASYRRRFRERHGELLEAIQGMFKEGALGAADFETEGDTLVCVCAWCKRLRGPDGVWVELPDYDASRPQPRVTHGICDRCRERFEAARSEWF